MKIVYETKMLVQTSMLLLLASTAAFSPRHTQPRHKQHHTGVRKHHDAAPSTIQSVRMALMSSRNDEGIRIVANEDVPLECSAFGVPIAFPEHWVPSEPHVYSLRSAEYLHKALEQEAESYGVLDGIGMRELFGNLDVHLLGGRARLQPGRKPVVQYLIHKLITLSAMWNQSFRGDGDLRLASIDRLKRLASIRSEGHDPDSMSRAIHEIQNEDPRDTPFMKWWDTIFHDIDFACQVVTFDQARRPLFQRAEKATNESTFYRRMQRTILSWCRALEREAKVVCPLETTEADLDRLWQLRVTSIGTMAVFDLLLHAHDIEPSEDLYRDLCRLRYEYAKITRAIEEIASIPSDLVNGCDGLFTSTMLVNGYSFDQTLAHFVKTIKYSIQEFDVMAATILAGPEFETEATTEHREQLEGFLRDVRYSAFGFGEWRVPGPGYEGSRGRGNRWKILRPDKQIVYDFCVKPLGSVGSNDVFSFPP